MTQEPCGAGARQPREAPGVAQRFGSACAVKTPTATLRASAASPMATWRRCSRGYAHDAGPGYLASGERG